MTKVTVEMVSTLRESTGAPLMKCKAALVEANGELVRAEMLLRQQGISASPVQLEGNHGYIAVYIHSGNQAVGLVELACSTDFVARSTEFQTVANELAMQVAAMAPVAIAVEDMPITIREAELQRTKEQIDAEPRMMMKPQALRDEIVHNKVAKILAEKCLLTQAYIRDPKVQVQSLIQDIKLKVREAVYVRRIGHWRVGQPL